MAAVVRRMSASLAVGIDQSTVQTGLHLAAAAVLLEEGLEVGEELVLLGEPGLLQRLRPCLGDLRILLGGRPGHADRANDLPVDDERDPTFQ